MIPYINDKENLAFYHLPDSISCEVTEELNGIFSLKMLYHSSGVNADRIAVGREIFAKPNAVDLDTNFIIDSVKREINGMISIVAYHASYALAGRILRPIDGDGNQWVASNSVQALSKIGVINNNRNYFVEGEWKIEKAVNAREALFGKKNSILSVYGGEIHFYDEKHAYYGERVGENRGVKVFYGVNLTDFTLSKTKTKRSIFPFAGNAENGSYIDLVGFSEMQGGSFIENSYDKVWVDDEGNAVFSVNDGVFGDFSEFKKTMNSSKVSEIADIAEAINISANQGSGTSQDDLFQKALERWNEEKESYSGIDSSVTADFVELANTEEYGGMFERSLIGIGDDIAIYADGGESEPIVARCQKMVFDVISEKYKRIHVGSKFRDLTDTIISATKT